ncbi:hypothetical protein BDV25DRAFT_158430 [Aspergillus avenaceus]|uniref:MADS-box domain-containing protein n=1 Tax=Aspergillus avenaceus TaxID=36643 RepID=A0A5N6TPV3_ASPAV|nr:hypothetical protein BDV25DRAFT_158430 [Aspergillus avenaceus]
MLRRRTGNIQCCFPHTNHGANIWNPLQTEVKLKSGRILCNKTKRIKRIKRMIDLKDQAIQLNGRYLLYISILFFFYTCGGR